MKIIVIVAALIFFWGGGAQQVSVYVRLHALTFMHICIVLTMHQLGHVFVHVHVCVCVCVIPQMYGQQQVSLWCECIIQTRCAGAAPDTVSQDSFFSPSWTLTALMHLTWRNQKPGYTQCSAKQFSSFRLSCIFHTFSVSTFGAWGSFYKSGPGQNSSRSWANK